MVERGRQVHLLPRGEVGEVPLRRKEEGGVLLRRGTRGEALPRRRRRVCEAEQGDARVRRRPGRG